MPNLLHSLIVTKTDHVPGGVSSLPLSVFIQYTRVLDQISVTLVCLVAVPLPVKRMSLHCMSGSAAPAGAGSALVPVPVVAVVHEWSSPCWAGSFFDLIKSLYNKKFSINIM